MSQVPTGWTAKRLWFRYERHEHRCLSYVFEANSMVSTPENFDWPLISSVTSAQIATLELNGLFSQPSQNNPRSAFRIWAKTRQSKTPTPDAFRSMIERFSKARLPRHLTCIDGCTRTQIVFAALSVALQERDLRVTMLARLSTGAPRLHSRDALTASTAPFELPTSRTPWTPLLTTSS